MLPIHALCSIPSPLHPIQPTNDVWINTKLYLINVIDFCYCIETSDASIPSFIQTVHATQHQSRPLMSPFWH